MPPAACRASSVVFRAIASDLLAAASQLLADVQRFGLQMVEFRMMVDAEGGAASTSASTQARTAIQRFSAPASHDIPLSVRSRSSDDRRPTRKARRRERPGRVAGLLKASGVSVLADISLAANGRTLTQMDDEGFVRIVARASDYRVLGAQAVAGASELTSSLALAIEMGAVLEDFAGAIGAHLTRSEAIHEAALGA